MTPDAPHPDWIVPDWDVPERVRAFVRALAGRPILENEEFQLALNDTAPILELRAPPGEPVRIAKALALNAGADLRGELAPLVQEAGFAGTLAPTAKAGEFGGTVTASGCTQAVFNGAYAEAKVRWGSIRF